jgi:hypothetical protein
MTWRDLLVVRINEHGAVELHISWVLVAAMVAAVVLYLVIRYAFLTHGGRFDVVEAEVKLGGIGSVKIRPSYEEVQIAHRAWAELSTRKAALPFEEQNDVIAEVYDSWYELFGRMRDLVKEIPAQKLRSSQDTRELVRLLVDALNHGLRPHLTKWQARFRRWYVYELELDKGAPPQEIQRRYPHFTELVKDLKNVNGQILEYSEVLKRISQG